MRLKNDLVRSGPSTPAVPRAPRKRFRVEKLEERIAPKKKGGGSGTTTGVPATSYSTMSY